MMERMAQISRRHARTAAPIDSVRHSLAHLLAAAVVEKFPKAKLGIGPVIEHGFYYDFKFPGEFSADALPALEKRMRELARAGLPFSGKRVTAAQAKKLFKDQPFKIDLIKDFAKEKKPLTVYKTGDVFTDLCRGGHVKNTKEIPADAFTLTHTAGAYWKGSEKNSQLTRIYGLAFANKKELDAHLAMLKEAEKRDHRVIGERLEFFMVDEEIGRGLPLWLPKGYAIRHKLEDYMYNLERKEGYLHVLTPHIAKEDLYKKSGHLAHYREDMYAPIAIDEERYYLKPMNCPHHHSIYKHHKRSYRELPLRIAEFGTVYRHERSGVLSGLMRVRGFTQNDSHIYTDEERLESEVVAVLKLHKQVYDDFNIHDYWYRLSLPDFKNKEKFGDVKNKTMWEKGAKVLRRALQTTGHKFVEAVGEASFYGPKIDIQIRDIYGKEDTIATIQADFYSAGRFHLSYVDRDGKEKPTIIVHRAIFGSFDRFFAFLIERTMGAMPLWLAPVQATVLPVSEKVAVYAKTVADALRKKDVAVELGEANETLGKRIRGAELMKIPYVLVVGEKEAAKNTVSVRRRGDPAGKNEVTTLAEFANRVKKEIEEKKLAWK